MRGGKIVRSMITAVVAIALLLLLAGCSQEPVTAPTTEAYVEARAQAKTKTERAQAQAASQRPTTKPGTGAVLDQAGETNLADGFGAVGDRYVYESEGRRDPFRAFQFMNDEEATGDFGPLGDYELQQLSVVAVVWDTGKPRALVADPGGRSFIVHEGSQIGKNKGRVIHIGDNLVLVKETYVNFAGEQTTKDVEMRIRSSQGG